MTGSEQPEQPSVDGRSGQELGDQRYRRRTSVMKDVAELAGVSQMTVSRVINHQGNVANVTRERVLEAMEQLQYTPNLAARTLVSGRSHVIGVVSFDTTLYGPASVLSEIDRAARQAGYIVSIASLSSLDRHGVSEAVARLRSQSVDGIIVITAHEEIVGVVRTLPRDVPIVGVEAGGVEGGVPVVAVDQYAGATAATDHLLELGHGTVWHISGPLDWLEAQDRLRGWKETLASAGVAPPDHLEGDWSPRSGYELGMELLSSQMTGKATAVFVANDQMALGLLSAAHELNIDVPNRLSVVGFDDIPEARFFTPPLTTVFQDFRSLGRLSLQVLVDEIDGTSHETEVRTVAPVLVRRATTAAPG